MATFSDHWYRVAGLHPRLRSHVEVDRHCYRGEIWHVLKDPLSGRQHRLNALGWSIVARLDGRLSVQQVWDLAVGEASEPPRPGQRPLEAPTQPETIALLAQLHEAELIQAEAVPDVDALFDRADQRLRRQRLGQLNPLALRAGLVDPTPLLDALLPLGRLILRPWALWAWAALVLGALALLAPQAGALAAYAHLHLSTPRLLLVLWLAYPLTKLLHELAHALAVRVWGGEVHELGISLLLLMPVPYVDASAAAGFRQRGRRVLVSLMGILAETALAALAAGVWLLAADGVVREAAFAVMLIGGASTLLFNGNPLLRMDAYHALADAIESPGLATRSTAWWRWMAQRHALGLADAQPPAMAPGERAWLAGYGLAAAVYRVVVALLVVGWLVGVQPLLGALAALALFIQGLALPAWNLLRYAHRAPELAGRRGRAAAVSALALGLPLAALFAMPLPDGTRAQGVVWAPEQAQLRNADAGFVAQVLVADGQSVAAGQPLLQLQDPVLDTELAAVDARLRGLDVAWHQALFERPAQANALAQDIARAQAEQARLQQRRAGLLLRAGTAGRIALPNPADLPGRWLARGTLVGHVLGPGPVQVRVVVSEADVARLQQQPGAIAVRLADAPQHALSARLAAQAPAALRQLPSPALADRAGGPVLTDPADPDGLRTLEPLYALDLLLPRQTLQRLGTRAWVRFDHGSRPLAQQWLHRLRQVFIGRLGTRPVAPALGTAAPAAAPSPQAG